MIVYKCGTVMNRLNQVVLEALGTMSAKIHNEKLKQSLLFQQEKQMHCLEVLMYKCVKIATAISSLLEAQ